MKHSLRFFLMLLCFLPAFSACSDLKQTRNLYDDWWPVHASGSQDNDRFSAQWNGDLGIHGDIVIKFVSKNNPSLSYEDTKYYPMLSFSKSRKAFCTVSIESLGELRASKYLGFKVDNGKIFFEKANKQGRGTGEYDDGQSLTFVSDDVVQIGDVTYERYSYFKKKHPDIFKSLAEKGFDLERPPIIFAE